MLVSNERVSSLWIGDKLSPLEVLCINSYLQNGHVFELYTYNEIQNVPEQTKLVDANEIIPNSDIFSISLGTHKNSFAIFSDYFRYKLLFEIGGWWTDLDAICMKPLDFSQEYLFINEKTRNNTNRIANGVIKCPPRSPIMEYCHSTVAEMIATKNVIQWGQTGPKLLAQAVEKFGQSKNCVPFEYFIPLGYFEINKLISGGWDFHTNAILKTAYSIHFFNSMWEVNYLPKCGFYDKRSIFECLKKKYGVKNSTAEFLSELITGFMKEPSFASLKKLILKFKNGVIFSLKSRFRVRVSQTHEHE